MKDCLNCKYLLVNDDSSDQSCSKWVKINNTNIPCPEGETTDCTKMECPSHCQFPFPKEVYKEEYINENHYGLMGKVDYKTISEDPEIMNSFLDISLNLDSIKGEFIEYTSDNVPDVELKCGPLHVPESGKTMNGLVLPSSDVLEQVIQYNTELNDNGINWSAVKETDGLINGDYQFNEGRNGIIVNWDGIDYTVPIAENGFEVEWWERDPLSEEELMSLLPTYIREFYSLDEIHKMTAGILENAFPTHTVNNIVSEQIIDWLRKNEIERENTEISEKFTLAKFFGIRTDKVTNRDFEICMNQLLITEHDDEEHLKNINQLTNLTELGDPNNRKDLLYVEAKIIKFLIIDPKNIRDCFDIVYITDEICQIGLTSNPTQMMGKFLKLNTDNVDDEKYDDKMRVITKRLLKYLPDIIEKVIEIAEYYEKEKCNKELHKNTKLLKEIYSSLFKQNTMDFDLPNLGITEFFRDFHENIITKIILLIFIAYLVTQFIKLFRVNVSLSGGKNK